ncbi:MAG: tetratricopeptide repeat protein [Saprospiraceae bacterium]
MKKQKTRNTNHTNEPIAKTGIIEQSERAFTLMDFLGLLLIMLLGCIIYSNSFAGSFHFDDAGRIVENTAIRDLSNIKAIWEYGQMRFVAYYTFAINYHFGKLDVWGYHLVNLLIHLIVSVLVYILSLLICSTPVFKDTSVSKSRYTIAFITAILFVSHPLATQSVSYLVQRMASLVSMFYLMSLCFYLKARILDSKSSLKYAWFVFSIISAGLAFFTKENAYTIPFAILLLEIFFLNEKKLTINFKDVKTLSITIALLAFIVIVIKVYSASIFKALPPDEHSNFVAVNSINYLFTQFSVILKYIQLLILPVGLNLDYDFPISNSFFNPITIGSFIILLGLIYLALRLFNQNRMLSFGIFWFFLTLIIESSIVPISDVIYEHRTYLPSFGFFLIVSVLCYQRLWLNNRIFGIAFLVLVVGSNSLLTYARNKVWKNDFTLWNDVIAKSPNKARGYNNRGMLLKETTRFDEMLKDFDKAIELQPTYTDAYNNRGNVYVKQEKYNEALINFNKAVELNPSDADSNNNRGTANMGMKHYADAILDFNKAIELRPEYMMAYANRGITYLNMGNKDKGCNDLQKSIQMGFEPTKAIYNQYCRDTSKVK